MKIAKLKTTVNYIILTVLGIGAISLVLAATSKTNGKRCKGIDVVIKNNNEQFLFTKTDVEKWVTKFGNDPFNGKIIENINLATVEKRVYESGYAKKCEAFTDLQGNLVIEIEAFKPIARILSNTIDPDRLIDIDGNIFPVSKHFTPNVTLLSGDFFNNIRSLLSKKNEDILKLIQFINNDDFWEAQITQLNIDSKKEIAMVPLMGNFIIEFGKPEKINTKFNKLSIFYKQILTQNDWSKFNKISVKYDGQIVCN